MISLSTAQFEAIVGAAIDAIPEPYGTNLQNVVFVVEDEPSAEQRRKLRLHPNETLFGLYEGIPLTQRGSNYNLVLPDKITIFKDPLLRACQSEESVRAEVKHTVWHEVAHYYGLDHERIHALEHRRDLRARRTDADSGTSSSH